jgi:DNA mismatch repair protein MutS2
MNGNSFRTLEFETIRALVLSHTGSPAGRSRVEALAPHTEAGAVRAALDLTSEGVRLLQKVGRQPYHDLPDVRDVLAAARVRGMHLEPRALADVASFIEGATEATYRIARAEGAPRLARRASELRDASDVAGPIRRAILPSGEVADHASPRLAELRRALVRLRSELTSVMESFLRGKDADRVLQDKLVTTRNDRYVLLLKAEHRGQIPGVIHGSSGSGASFFVEPMPAVELNNDIVAAAEDEQREVVRILTELTSRVRDRVDDLQDATEIVGELDAVQAMALTAGDMGALPPQIAAPGELRLALLEARHPLLMPALCERLGLTRRSSREPVPVTLRIGDGDSASVLIISGPNTGGKTVALKTMGLLALMAQCGLHIPAKEGSVLPVFRRIFADIGDEQSIEANLSTFSAHLANIVSMTRDLARPALVLLDEVGAGTDPTEGGALGVAIVDHFRARGAMVVATTHHGLMKAYGQATPGVACASFSYDPATYEPTYQLVLGAAGRSLALEMAERLGLPTEAVHDARARLDDKEAQAEALLKTLEAREVELRAEHERQTEERRALEAERAEVEARAVEIESRKRHELAVFRDDLRRRSEEAARKAADAIREAVKRLEETRRTSEAAVSRVRSDALRDIRAVETAALADSGIAAPEAEAPAAVVSVGSRVKVRSLGVVGEVMSVSGQDAELTVGGKRLRAPLLELVPLAGKAAAQNGGTASAFAASKGQGSRPGVPAEINLVGLTVDEALPRVDKLLDDASLSDRHEIRLIHGFGEGRLKKALAGFLEGHPHVASVHLGSEGRGGVTVVELKD